MPKLFHTGEIVFAFKLKISNWQNVSVY